jgi:ADP-dependent NAD(P)H-hydrate dehydratase
MSDISLLDASWLAAHRLPCHAEGTDKDGRGRVLLAGGAALVPGALRLTGEAALRAGAGKLRMATVESVATALGVLVPEAAMMALPANDRGEISADAIPILREALERSDAYVLGPGMGDKECAAAIIRATLNVPRDGLAILLDAAAVACAGSLGDTLRRHEGRLVLTPHHGEMSGLTGRDVAAIAADPQSAASAAAKEFGAVVVLKAGDTVIADPSGAMLLYEGGGVGLATGGSGDVLAGIIGGLLARGAPPLTAASWGVWLHGEAGRLVAARLGPVGLLARDLLPEIPALMVRGEG